jgi:thiosulfate dehydrogenase
MCAHLFNPFVRSRSPAASLTACVITALTLGACTLDTSRRTSDSVSVAGARQAGTSAFDAEAWAPPAITEVPGDSLGASIRRGLALVSHTHDSLPRFTGSNLNCTSCHLDEGRRESSAALSGVYARYPRYIDRAGAVVPIEDRVNYCMTRSLAGTRLPNDSREMQDIVAYLAFLSRGMPIGSQPKTTGLPKMPAGISGDSSRGRVVFARECTRCHGGDGAGAMFGNIVAPALWGAKSFSIGASMSRRERAASFIRQNMPYDKPGSLDDQDAFDVAALITAMPRPDLPGKEHDWPLGGAPSDVPYATKGHVAYHPPPILARKGSAAGVMVPPPKPLMQR